MLAVRKESGIERVTRVVELGTRLLTGELPVDFDAVPVDPAVPGSRFPLQDR